MSVYGIVRAGVPVCVFITAGGPITKLSAWEGGSGAGCPQTVLLVVVYYRST